MQWLWLRYYCIFTEGSFGIKRFHKTTNSELHYLVVKGMVWCWYSWHVAS